MSISCCTAENNPNGLPGFPAGLFFAPARQRPKSFPQGKLASAKRMTDEGN